VACLGERAANVQQEVANAVHPCPPLSTRKGHLTRGTTRRAQVGRLRSNGLLIRRFQNSISCPPDPTNLRLCLFRDRLGLELKPKEEPPTLPS
jgi:hypothetical protein